MQGFTKFRMCRWATFLLIVVGIVCAISSGFAIVSATEMALDYYPVMMTIDDQTLYENGRFFIGPGHYFLKFPKSLRTIKLVWGDHDEPDVRSTTSLQSRTKDGLPVDMELSFQYRLVPTTTDLIALYKDFEMNYESAFVRISRDSLRNAASRFTAFEMFYNRTELLTDMQSSLDSGLQKHHATIQSFQILNIRLPERFANVIEEMEITRQAIDEAGYSQTVANIEAETEVLLAAQSARILQAQGDATANSTVMKAKSVAHATFVQRQAESNAYAHTKQQVNFDEAQVLAFSWLKTLQGFKSIAKQIMTMDLPTAFGKF